MNQRQGIRDLKEGYHIFYAVSKEDGGQEKVASQLQDLVNEAKKFFKVDYIGNAKIDSDNGGGRSVYFGYQCAEMTLLAKWGAPHD